MPYRSGSPATHLSPSALLWPQGESALVRALAEHLGIPPDDRAQRSIFRCSPAPRPDISEQICREQRPTGRRAWRRRQPGRGPHLRRIGGDLLLFAPGRGPAVRLYVRTPASLAACSTEETPISQQSKPVLTGAWQAALAEHIQHEQQASADFSARLDPVGAARLRDHGDAVRISRRCKGPEPARPVHPGQPRTSCRLLAGRHQLSATATPLLRGPPQRPTWL